MTKDWETNRGQQENHSGDPKTLKQVSPRWPRYSVNQSPGPYEPEALGHKHQRQEYQQNKREMNQSSHHCSLLRLSGYIKLVNYGKEQTLDLNRILADLKQERDRLGPRHSSAGRSEIDAGCQEDEYRHSAFSRIELKGKERGGITPEGRRRLSIAMKKRWAERKRNGS
jgi:hypothetical protein